MNKISKVVFPVGGLGTRFLPATKSLPKEMLPLGIKPIIHHAYDEAVASEIEEFIFITGRNKNSITNHFDNAFELERNLNEKDKKEALSLTREWLPAPGNMVFVRQQMPYGLGHAVWCARNLIQDGEFFAVILADELFLSQTPVLKKMIQSFNDKNMIGVTEVDLSEASRYGIVETEGNNIINMVEKPKNPPSNKAIVGRYILHSDIFKYIERTDQGTGSEIQLTDAMKLMMEAHEFEIFNITDERIDCGTPLGYFEANIKYALHNPETREAAIKALKGIKT